MLARYQAGHLRAALHLLGAATVVAYFFYTRAPHTVAFFGTTRMVWTVPLCMVGIARFLHLVIRERGGDSPTEKMLKDLPFMANLAVWALSVVVVIYLR